MLPTSGLLFLKVAPAAEGRQLCNIVPLFLHSSPPAPTSLPSKHKKFEQYITSNVKMQGFNIASFHRWGGICIRWVWGSKKCRGSSLRFPSFLSFHVCHFSSRTAGGSPTIPLRRSIEWLFYETPWAQHCIFDFCHSFAVKKSRKTLQCKLRAFAPAKS